ncbi:hypothetical protein Y1Q_0017261 [Alligator mississippiensis]|uniref:Uncharacterized protein n=1 Tax=Alligator mississippiensis TaxID=8496 RepID=A0A151NKX5_ALLMI|nr:hypothetical protein Y1Q_0017261 [Alligator mississippiensis]
MDDYVRKKAKFERKPSYQVELVKAVPGHLKIQESRLNYQGNGPFVSHGENIRRWDLPLLPRTNQLKKLSVQIFLLPLLFFCAKLKRAFMKQQNDTHVLDT